MPRIDPVRRRRESARRLLVVPSPDGEERSVFVLRRFDSGALLAAGIAEILGPEAIAGAQEQVQRDRDRESLLADAPEGSEERERIEAEMVAEVEQRNVEFLAGLQRDAERQAAFLRRCDAYAIGAVEAMGIAREDVDDGVQEAGRDIAEVCIPLTDDENDGQRFAKHITLVKGATTKPNELPIYELSMGERLAIGWAAIAVLEVASQLRPFRRGPGHARAR